MIGAFDINFEKLLIKKEAEECLENLMEHADRRELEKDFVFEEFLKQFKILIKKNKIL